MRSLLAVALIVLSAAARAGESPLAAAQRLDAGRRVYQAQCASCHGGRGEGAPDWQRPDKQGEMPAPPHDREGHTWKHADGMLYGIAKNGWRDPFNKTQRLTMPAFVQSLTPAEMRAVIDYLKTLWTPEQRRFQEEESRRAPYPPEARQDAADASHFNPKKRSKTMHYPKTLLMALALGLPLPALAADIPMKLYKNPNCGCCDIWAQHMEANGFKVEKINTTDLPSIQQKFGVPERLAGCHTAIVEGYVVEGLVPADFVKRLLKERSPVKGVALPGMPVGAPGMPGEKRAPLNVYYLGSSAMPGVFGSF